MPVTGKRWGADERSPKNEVRRKKSEDIFSGARCHRQCDVAVRSGSVVAGDVTVGVLS